MNQYNAREKAAIVTKKLLEGEVLTVPQVARMFDIHVNTARQIMEDISRVLPVIDDYEAQFVRDMDVPTPNTNPGNFAPRRWRICDLGNRPE